MGTSFKKLSQFPFAVVPPTVNDFFVGVSSAASQPTDVLFSISQVAGLIGTAVLPALLPAATAPAGSDQIIGIQAGQSVLFSTPQIQQTSVNAVAASSGASAAPTTGDSFLAVRGGLLEQFSFAQMQTSFPSVGGGLPTLPAAATPPAGSDNIVGIQAGQSVLFSNTQLQTNISANFVTNLAGLGLAIANPDGSDSFVAVRGGTGERFTFAQMQAAFGGGGGPGTFSTVPFVSTISSASALPTARSLITRFSDVVNVKDFGAVGDGATDDTVAVQAAFNWNQLAASAPTASGLTLTFAAVPAWIQKGMIVNCITNPYAIAGGVFVASFTATTVTLSFGVTSAVSTGDVIAFGFTGRIYFPPGAYLLTAPLKLPMTVNNGTSYVIEGAGRASKILGTFNGMLLDDTGFNGSTQAGTPSEIRNLLLQNSYRAPLIHKSATVTATAPWGANANSISVTNASFSGLNVNGGQILFTNTTFLNIPGYIGFVGNGSANVTVGATTTLTLADTLNGRGAQIPSGGSIDNISAVQGFYAASSWTTAGNTATISSGTYTSGTGAVSLTLGSSVTIPVGAQVTVSLSGAGGVASRLSGLVTATAGTSGTTLNFSTIVGLPGITITGGTVSFTSITMAISNPGLDAGQYYVWDWSTVANGSSVIPRCIGATTAAAWQGTTLILTNIPGAASVGSADLLVLTPIAGCIRRINGEAGRISSCVLSGLMPVLLDQAGTAFTTSIGPSSFFTSIRDCNVQNSLSSAAIGTIGVYGGQATNIDNADMSGVRNGSRLSGVNTQAIGFRIETCAYGVVVGGLLQNGINSNLGTGPCILANFETEGTWIASVMTDTDIFRQMLITCASILANHNNACYGIYAKSASNLTVSNISVNGQASFGVYSGFWNPSFAGPGSPAGIYVADLTNPAFQTFISTQSSNGSPGSYNMSSGQLGQAWRMPTVANTAKFINCNNPPAIFHFANIPQGLSATAQISVNGAAGSGVGKIIKFTAGTFSPSYAVGSAVVGVNVAPGTFLVSQIISSANVAGVVNNTSLSDASGAVTVYPMVDGDEYLIDDSTLPYQPSFAAGASFALNATSITMGAALPFTVVAGMTVFNDTTNNYIGTVDISQVAGSSTLKIASPGATSASLGSADVLTFTQLTNVGSPIVVGGGTNHVKVRWSADRQNWILV